MVSQFAFLRSLLMSFLNSRRVAVATALFAVQGLISYSAVAQPVPTQTIPAQNLTLSDGKRGIEWLPGPVQSVDAEARTVTMKVFRLDTITIAGKMGRIKLETGKRTSDGELETIPLAPDATILRLEKALRATALQVGDTVTLLGQPRPTPFVNGNGQPIPELSPRIVRYGSKAEFFKVASLQPLTLTKGKQEGGAEIANLPFSIGPDSGTVGTLRVVSSEAGLSVNLTLTPNENLEFDRFTPISLSEVAASVATEKVGAVLDFDTEHGKRQVKRLFVTSKP
jgi:hypothetical protein